MKVTIRSRLNKLRRLFYRNVWAPVSVDTLKFGSNEECSAALLANVSRWSRRQTGFTPFHRARDRIDSISIGINFRLLNLTISYSSINMSQASGSSDAVCDKSSSESREGLHNNGIFFRRIMACMNGEEEVKRSILSTDETLSSKSKIKNPMNGERDSSSTIGKPQKRSRDSSSTLSTATATATSADTLSSEASEDNFEPKDGDSYSFFLFRMSYLIVTFVIMLADGLQGKIYRSTHQVLACLLALLCEH
jgi:hypothetical protein